MYFFPSTVFIFLLCRATLLPWALKESVSRFVSLQSRAEAVKMVIQSRDGNVVFPSYLQCQPSNGRVLHVNRQKKNVFQVYLVKHGRVPTPLHDVFIKWIMRVVLLVRRSYAAYAAPALLAQPCTTVPRCFCMASVGKTSVIYFLRMNTSIQYEPPKSNLAVSISLDNAHCYKS